MMSWAAYVREAWEPIAALPLRGQIVPRKAAVIEQTLGKGAGSADREQASARAWPQSSHPGRIFCRNNKNLCSKSSQKTVPGVVGVAAGRGNGQK